MRTFPGVWVPPGGGVEAGDAGMIDAAVRELREETGVVVGPEEGQAARILGLWGSKAHLEVVFPIFFLIFNFKARLSFIPSLSVVPDIFLRFALSIIKVH